MDLTPEAVLRVIEPTAAYAELFEPPNIAVNKRKQAEVVWNESRLNPKNRIDSLDEVVNPRWRIDGCTSFGTQFYTIPLFFGELHPMRVDTFIPEPSRIPLALRQQLDLATAFHRKDSRVARLGIARHILRTLEYWSSTIADFETVYHNLPFGSRIVFENLTSDIRDIRVNIVQTHDLERQLLSKRELQVLRGFPSEDWPETVDISCLEHLGQLHESVSVVQVRSKDGNKTEILKALTSYPKYLYHELRTLLSLPPHPNIIGRPLHLVSKRCRWGGNTAIIGFMTKYHSMGTLRDALPRRAIHGSLTYDDQLKWSIQITSALIHVGRYAGFYPDLRLENIVLSNSDDLIMVDFEQRGVWSGFSAPEVNYLGYMNTLAMEPQMPKELQERYRAILLENCPEIDSLQSEEYRNPKHGYCIPWLCLDPDESESAEVYMLGRLLWCIFEGVSSPEEAVWQSYRHESDITFPSYRQSSVEIRELIDRCTRGRRVRGANDGGIIRKGNRLMLRGGDGQESEEEVRREATAWWKRELRFAEDFLERRRVRKFGGTVKDIFGRPRLEGVLVELRKLELAYKAASAKGDLSSQAYRT